MAIYPKSGHALLYTTFDRWNEMPYKSCLCLVHSISSLMPHKHQTPSSLLIIIMSQHLAWSFFKWYDPLHIITWPLWSIDLNLARSSPSPRSIGAKSCSSFPATCGLSLQSLQLALHTCNQSIDAKPCLDLLHLATRLHVMSHMQWVPSSHYMSIASTLSHFSSMAHVAHTSVFVWTNHLCISTWTLISPPKLSLNYQNQTRAFQGVAWQWVPGKKPNEKAAAECGSPGTNS